MPESFLTQSGESMLPRIGSYTLLQPLGSGGMSSVYRAQHVDNGLVVALKLLPRSLAKNPVALQRFLREAKSAESLEHPNIVAIYDRGVDHGRHYIVLEYMPGGDLHDSVRARGPLPVDRVLAVARSVADGLRYAASRGVIHRDIKPANLLLDANGHVKIADLGLALQDAEDERVTREGTTVGTVDYMAPEQARDSRATSVRSDIYSLGCTLYYLLTGQPPFAGGDVADKLARHITAPAPDVRAARPEVPESLAKLIKVMMAKRPEARYDDYDDVLRALDRVDGAPAQAVAPASSVPKDAPLDAIIDDEDEDALIPLDDDDDDAILLTEAPGAGGPAVSRETRSTPHAADLVPILGELAALDDEPPRAAPPPDADPRPVLTRGRSRRKPVPPPTAPVAEEDDDALELEEATLDDEGATAPVAAGLSQDDRAWITKLILLGVGLVFAVILTHQVLRSTGDDAGETVPTDEDLLSQAVVGGAPTPAPDANRESTADVDLAAAVVARPAPTPEPVRRPPPVEPTPEVVVAEPPWVEPTDPFPDRPAEPTFPAGVEARYLPDWVERAAPPRSGRTLVVRRLAAPGDPAQKPTLRAAVEVAGALVEVADNGPFFEEGFRVVGESRHIRARPGYRPIVALGRSVRPIEGRPSALFDVGSRDIVLEGLDLILDVADLPASTDTLFALKGGSLTLRDCTVTVVNAKGLPFTLVKTAPLPPPKASRVLFDRSYVRGSFAAVVEASGGPVDVALIRSLWLNGKERGASVSFSSPTSPAGVVRRVTAVRSLVVGAGPLIERADVPPGQKPRPVTVRALGTTFAHFATSYPAALLTSGNELGTANDLVEWQGDANRFDGFAAWATAGPSRKVRVPGLDAARAVWPGTDPESFESPQAWPSPAPSADRVGLDQIASQATDRRALLGRLPQPAGWLHEKTVTVFQTPSLPGLSGLFGDPATAPATSFGGAGRNLPNGLGAVVPPGAPGRATPGASIGSGRPGVEEPATSRVASLDTRGVPASSGQSARDLTFDAAAAGHGGDLGQFLASQVRSGDRLVRVRVTGRGVHPWTPVRLPPGVSLEIRVEGGMDGFTPTWAGVLGSEAPALLEVTNGSLVLDGLVLDRDGSSRLGAAIRVTRGHLVLRRCRLKGPGLVESGGGTLLVLDAPTTQPVRAVGGTSWPYDEPTTKPTCRIIDSTMTTGGEALRAELGRGLVALSNSVVAAGRSAFTLNPGRVARDRFEADLLLDRCTVASERAVISLGPWRGTVPGPDRPWLVTTQSCAVFGSYERPDPETVLVRADAEALAHGVLFAQGSADVFEVDQFLAASEQPLRGDRRPDVRFQWVGVWGDVHARGVSGTRGNGGSGVRTVSRLRPGDVQPGDLAIDPATLMGRRSMELGADFHRLGIAPTPR